MTLTMLLLEKATVHQFHAVAPFNNWDRQFSSVQFIHQVKKNHNNKRKTVQQFVCKL